MNDDAPPPAVTVEQVAERTPGRNSLLTNLAEFANHRLAGMSPQEACRNLGVTSDATKFRYESWWRRFADETGLPYVRYQDSFTKQLGPPKGPIGAWQ